MNLTWQIVRLQLKETFSISYGDYSFREALIIELNVHGISGYGECTAIDYYHINLADYSQKLHFIKSSIEKQQIIPPTEFYAFLLTLELPSFLRSALDCAYWDLFGKLEHKNFLTLNKINYNELPQSSITISIAPITIQLQKIENSLWNKFKVKLNAFNDADLQSLLKTGKEVALDANGSFTKQQCQWLENYEASKNFTYIEQPLKPGIENYTTLHQNAYPNWMADEDCQENSNLQTLKPHYKSINIKLVKCGGLTPALQVIQKAKELGLQTMIGCMTESTIGISAGAVLTPLVDYVDLDGANLIANDIAAGSTVSNGKVLLTDKPGLGIKMI